MRAAGARRSPRPAGGNAAQPNPPFLSLAAAAIQAAATPDVFTLDFAHFANGGSITSDLVFVNPGSIPIRPAVYFYDTGSM